MAFFRLALGFLVVALLGVVDFLWVPRRLGSSKEKLSTNTCLLGGFIPVPAGSGCSAALAGPARMMDPRWRGVWSQQRSAGSTPPVHPRWRGADGFCAGGPAHPVAPPRLRGFCPPRCAAGLCPSPHRGKSRPCGRPRARARRARRRENPRAGRRMPAFAPETVSVLFGISCPGSGAGRRRSGEETSGRAAGWRHCASEAVFRPFWTGDVEFRLEARMTALRASGAISGEGISGSRV